ncbi:MAG: Imidazole glycerol phosphate synthase subunit HisH [Phycisphaerales bacterium]|nr:Imidazole glycerol phosphate synthase subunit HisH [Phycisphaerales bacterium]
MTADRPKVHIVRTGTANLASVVAALSRQGADPVLTSDAATIDAADVLVLPGVGSFAAAMDALRRADVAEVLTARINAGRPTLAICLGLQVLFEASEESPGVKGLGVVPGEITRFTGAVRVPQLGWNAVACEPSCRVLSDGDAYYANSYRAGHAPAGFAAAWSDHGGPFIAAIERGPVVACQFHPELSGSWGAALIRRWLAAAGPERGLSSLSTTKAGARC